MRNHLLPFHRRLLLRRRQMMMMIHCIGIMCCVWTFVSLLLHFLVFVVVAFVFMFRFPCQSYPLVDKLDAFPMLRGPMVSLRYPRDYTIPVPFPNRISYSHSGQQNAIAGSHQSVKNKSYFIPFFECVRVCVFGLLTSKRLTRLEISLLWPER